MLQCWWDRHIRSPSGACYVQGKGRHTVSKEGDQQKRVRGWYMPWKKKIRQWYSLWGWGRQGVVWTRCKEGLPEKVALNHHQSEEKLQACKGLGQKRSKWGVRELRLLMETCSVCWGNRKKSKVTEAVGQRDKNQISWSLSPWWKVWVSLHVPRIEHHWRFKTETRTDLRGFYFLVICTFLFFLNF